MSTVMGEGTLTIENGAALSDAFNYGSSESGMILIPPVWTAANIGFKHSLTEDGTYTMVEHHDSGEPVQISDIPTATSVWKELPPELAGCKWLKLWSKSATAATETNVNQGAARSISYVLKS